MKPGKYRIKASCEQSWVVDYLFILQAQGKRAAFVGSAV